MAQKNVLIVDAFTPLAPKLRADFDKKFADPKRADAARFVWDYWHVPEQYTLLRTPAYHYFPAELYRRFHEQLVWWGRRTLGCHDISPPWLSCYVDGCRQELHGDLPHGPWAFVFSLTRIDPTRFRGGETFLLRDEVLDFWQDAGRERAMNQPELVRHIAPKFNRLIAFDPRIPHGVSRVEGTADPRFGRLVIHGWFVKPRPFVEGPLPVSALQSRIDGLSEALAPHLAAGLTLAGTLSVRFAVGRAGTVSGVTLLSDTTRSPIAGDPDRKRVLRTISRAVGRFDFPRQRQESRVTLPITFA